MNNITIDQGETLDLLIEDTEAVSATILVSVNATTDPIIEKSATFADGSAQITLLHEDTDVPAAEYVYQIRLFDEDGEYFNLSSYGCTSGDCTLSKFIVCPSIPDVTESA